MDFRKAFDTVPCAVLWQVLEELSVHGRILDIIKSLYAHNSAAVLSSQGISAIFRCLIGVKQGCPLSPSLFGLYVNGLEKHLLETADIEAFGSHKVIKSAIVQQCCRRFKCCDLIGCMLGIEK